MTMEATNTINDVKVEDATYEDFFRNKAIYPIGIDSYQRPYVWTIDKVIELVEDLTEHLEAGHQVPYYMGTILLHQNEEAKRLYLIDGQQRMTTLSILYFIVHGTLLSDRM